MLPHVSAEHPGSAQVLPADPAEVRVGVGVRVNVVGELQGAAEALAAQRTLVADGRVSQLVVLEDAELLEGLGADGALEGPGVGVHTLVAAHCAGEGEALAADGAGEGFLARVDPLVLRHVDVLDEALPAGGTLEGTLARVDPKVLLQRRGLEAVPAADRAAVPGLPWGAAVRRRIGEPLRTCWETGRLGENLWSSCSNMKLCRRFNQENA